MEIREIQPEDSEKFAEFYEQLAEESEYLPLAPEEMAEKLEKGALEEKNNGRKKVFLAVEDEKIIGYLAIARSRLERLMHVAKLTMGVLEEYQRQGVATKLLKYAEKWAEDNDIKRLELTVVENNESAVEFFEEMDYDDEGTRKGSVKHEDDYIDEIYMAKIL